MSTLLRLVSRLLCLVLLGALAFTVTAPPASASWTLLCWGYSGCAHAGLSDAGYGTASHTMYWRMYSGHNCTNYAAYRMVQAGLPNERPWTGSGNATNWGVELASITNDVPAVGAVAWWRAGANPAGSSGHVAYVERVLSPTHIVISQDSWSGDFSWAEIDQSTGSWPSGFIHLRDVGLASTARPTVTGHRRVGSRLTASAGAWTPAPTRVRYQWRAAGVDIAGATGSTFDLTPAQQGLRVRVLVTASKHGYHRVTVRSHRTRAVAPGIITGLHRPDIAGSARVGETLTTAAGQPSPSTTGVRYQWAAGGSPLAGATGSSLTVTPALVGKRLSVGVTASAPGYTSVAATSEPTSPVARGTITVSATPAVVGAPRPGRLLRLRGAFPADTTVSVQWWRGAAPVQGAGGTTYRVGAADLGARLSAHLTVTRPGYQTLTLGTAALRRVRSAAHLRVTARTVGGRVNLTARVRAADVSPVTGWLRVSRQGRVVRLLRLHDGVAATRLSAAPAGFLRVRYLRTTTVTAAVRRIRTSG